MTGSLQPNLEGLRIIPEPARDILSIVGAEGQSWLNGLVTCDLSTLDRGHGVYGLLLTKQGKIQSDLDVVVGDSGLFLAVAPGLGAHLASTLDRHLVMEDAEIAAREELAAVRLVGPTAAETASALAGSVAAGGAIDWVGLGGALVVAPRQELARILERAVELGGPGARIAVAAEWDALRIPRGFPLFGVDYGPEDNPHEASLEQLAVSFSKGCYLGQEVVCMQDMRGKVKRRVTPLNVAGVVSRGAPVFASGGEQGVGEVTSVSVSGASSAVLARLRAPFFEGSSELSVAGLPTELLRPRGQ